MISEPVSFSTHFRMFSSIDGFITVVVFVDFDKKKEFRFVFVVSSGDGLENAGRADDEQRSDRSAEVARTGTKTTATTQRQERQQQHADQERRHQVITVFGYRDNDDVSERVACAAVAR